MKAYSVLLAICLTSPLFSQPTCKPRRVSAVVDGYPSLSPDGSTVLFESDRTGNSEIYTMTFDGKGLKQLTFNDFNDDSPVWSPDGKQIAFTSLRDDPDGDIYVMDADGKNVRRLTSTPGDDSHPKFTADGSKIVFNSARTTPDLTVDWGKQFLEIFVMNADGSNVKQLTNFRTVSTYPSLSPDGKKLLFRRAISTHGFNWDLSTNSRNSEVFVMDIATGTELNLSNNAAYDGWPAWTPDGRIIFASNRGGIASRSALYLINADGTGIKLITDQKYSYNQHSVSPDGKYILAERNAESMAGIDILEFNDCL